MITKLGDCFQVAVQVATERATAKDHAWIVHGLPIGTGPANRGKRFWHAWVEIDLTVEIPPEMLEGATGSRSITTTICLDRSNGHDTQLPKEVYYKVGQLEEQWVWRFTLAEAVERMNLLDHYGPWVYGYQLLKGL